MGGFGALLGILNKLLEYAKLIGAFLLGARRERRKQEDAAREDAEDAREKRDEAKGKSREELIDSLRPPDTD